jgi:hypothetical protein
MNIMKKYKSQLQEMAFIGKDKDLIVQVYSDHNPPHFHVTKKDEYEVKLTIKNLKIIGYVWQKDNTEISSSELKRLLKWLQQPYVKNKDITNEAVIKISWETMNFKK